MTAVCIECRQPIGLRTVIYYGGDGSGPHSFDIWEHVATRLTGCDRTHAAPMPERDPLHVF